MSHKKGPNITKKHIKTKKRILSVKPISGTHTNPEWPYYKDIISQAEQNTLISELKALKFEYETKSYTPLLFRRKTAIIPGKFNGKYIKFVDKNYLKYDVIPLIYSEAELVKCRFRNNPAPITYFNANKALLWTEFKASKKTNDGGVESNNLAEFREFLYKKVKQCNNFRPTLAMQLYEFLGNAKSILDFSAGWGDRLFSACITGRKYIGIDPNINNNYVYDKIIADHGTPQDQRIITSGAEYVDDTEFKGVMESIGIAEFDLIFTSPPFFDYEIYSDYAQSMMGFTDSNKWLTYFLFYTILKYSKYLKIGGYMGIYIQDVGNTNYLEPIALCVLANADILGMTCSGIISSTRFPLIVFKKQGSLGQIYPYRNTENNRLFTRNDIISNYKKHYPALYILNSKLRHIYTNQLFRPIIKYRSDTTTKVSPRLVGIDNSSIYRAFVKFLLNMNSDSLVISDTKSKLCDLLIKTAILLNIKAKYSAKDDTRVPTLGFAPNTTTKVLENPVGSILIHKNPLLLAILKETILEWILINVGRLETMYMAPIFITGPKYLAEFYYVAMTDIIGENQTVTLVDKVSISSGAKSKSLSKQTYLEIHVQPYNPVKTVPFH